MTEAKTRGKERSHGNRWRIAAWSAAALILLLPLIAMGFTDQVNWSLADFVFAGGLILGTGIAFEVALRKSRATTYRVAVGVALVAAFLLVWLNAAVGLIGSEDNDANLLYGGVLAVGVLGAIAARFEPRGMAVALFATAAAQVLVAAIALAARLGAEGPKWPVDLLALTGFFVVLFAGSGLLFRNAAREHAVAME